MNIELNQEQLVTLYRGSNHSGKVAIKTALGDKFSVELPVTSRIATFDDAIEELGSEHEAVRAYQENYWKFNNGSADILAYLKLRVIVAALNEGWQPDTNTNEVRWSVWLEKGDEGQQYVEASHDPSSVNTNYASKLAFKNAELAEYAGRTFTDLYDAFYFNAQPNENN